MLRTNNAPLHWLRSFTDPEETTAYWQESLQVYDFQCVRRPEAHRSNADALC